MRKIIDIGKEEQFNKCIGKPPRPNEKAYSSMQQQQMFDIPDCPICCELMIKDLGVLVPCGHIFHQNCLKKYSKLECPVCRKQNNQSIPIHFSIEQNSKKCKEMKQNKQQQNKQFDQQQNNNQESINQIQVLISKGKQSVDQCYSQYLCSNQYHQNEKQRVRSCENLLQEITKIFRDIRTQIDGLSYSDNQSSISSVKSQKSEKLTPIKTAENPFSFIQNQNNIIDITDTNRSRTQINKFHYLFRCQSSNKNEYNQ